MKTTSGNYEFENGVITHLTEDKEFGDYLEILDSLTGGDIGIYEGAVDAMIFYAYDYMLAWDWENSVIFDENVSFAEIAEEAEWFQGMANKLFGVEDWRNTPEWETYQFTPNYENFEDA